MLSMPLEEIQAKGRRLLEKLAEVPGLHGQLVEEQGQVGGGSVPAQMIPTWAVALRHESVTPDQLETRLRLLPLPIIGRISKDRFLLDMRTTQEEYLDYIAQSVAQETARGGREETA
jgi:L-seryl-tRNA(Ser) seleniumtransferase